MQMYRGYRFAMRRSALLDFGRLRAIRKVSPFVPLTPRRGCGFAGRMTDDERGRRLEDDPKNASFPLPPADEAPLVLSDLLDGWKPHDDASLASLKGRCLSVARAVTTAVVEPTGSGSDDLVQWARRQAIEALKGVHEPRFWEALGAIVAGAQVRPPTAPPAPPEVAERLKDLLSDGLAQVLVEVGYRPPPASWILVRQARASVDLAVVGGAHSAEVEAARRNLADLIKALTDLTVPHGDSGRIRRLLFRAREVSVAAATVVLTVLAHEAVQELGEEFVYSAMTQVVADIIQLG